MSDADALPSGIVTFVFTDIEGSTRLLRRLGDRYPEVLERHFALLREAWDAHGGHEIDGTGDSVMVAFRDTSAAVQACAAAQRALAGEAWPAGGAVRVRMGVHAGIASPSGSRYVALAVHQAARVMSAAHGGQVLVSADAVALLTVACEVAIVPVGRFRLRDFDEPVQLFSLAESVTTGTFPPVRALPADGHNLVTPRTSFLGRDTAVSDLAGAVGPGRLVTLTGPGGVGKTRLALEVGRAVVPSWADGVWFVDLAKVDDAAGLAPAIGDAVGAPVRDRDPLREVVEHLRDRDALVILDNCEHVLTAIADIATRLLTACRGVGVLATSRESLGVHGELVRRVSTLDDDAAVALFVDRARAVRDDVAADGTVVGICERLDGLPLALELAAARLAELSPDDVLRGLDDRFGLLRSRRQHAPARQRTMEDVIEWSYRLLDEPAQRCLRALGGFGASFTVDAAVAAVGGDAAVGDDVPDLVWSLVDKSLVVADLTANQTRYRLLESVRDFALTLLREHGELGDVAARLGSWYLARIGPAHRHERGWVGDVRVELDNVRSLIPHVAASDPEDAQALALAVGRYLGMVHSSQEGIAEVSRHLDRIPDATPTRVALLATLADLHLTLADIPAAKGALADAEALFGEVGALPAWDDGALARTRAELANRSGDLSSAAAVARQALEADLSLEARGRLWCQLGIALGMLGDLDGAEHAFRNEHEAWEALGDEWLQVASSGNLAEIAMRRGDLREAARRQLQCLREGLELGAEVTIAFSLVLAARIAAAGGDWESAATLHGRADAMLDACGVVLYEDDRVLSEAMLDGARRQLGESRYGVVRGVGLAMDVPSAAAAAERVLRAAGS